MSYGLTPRLREVFDLIERMNRDAEGRLQPSYEDLRVELGLKSKGSVYKLVQQLRDRGWIHPSSFEIVREDDPEEPIIVGFFDPTPELLAELLPQLPRQAS